MLTRICSLLCLFLIATSQAAPTLLLPKKGIQAQQLAVVINENDPLSVEVGELYAKARDIPSEHVVRLRFSPTETSIKPEIFASLKDELDKQLPDQVQALLLTWIKPYRVGCMSITSAFTFGYDPKYCSPKQCAPTAASAYFNSWSEQPFTQLKLRPSMLFGATSAAEATNLIERGLQSEKHKSGTAYLLSTSDKARNARAVSYDDAERLFSRWIKVETLAADVLKDKDDVMFYFTGLPKVEALNTNRFLPGAVGDHLTSFGGRLTDSSQMSALEWIKAGATGSYGTVMEPCAHRQKFPEPMVLMTHYLAGERLIEAYWKSVAWPGEGLFIGDPLAQPFPGYFTRRKGNTWSFELPYLASGRYRLSAAPSAFGPFKTVGQLISKGEPVLMRLPQPIKDFYRLERLPEL